MELDPIDIKLLAELQQDCKQPLNRLGECVGLSAPAVMERIRKLEGAGVIAQYPAVLDARKVGLDIAAFIGVSIRYPARIEGFEEWVDQEAQVLECHHVTGAHTLLVKVKARSTQLLEELISRIRSLDGVERTETMVVLSTYAERTQVALPEAAPAPASRTKSPRRKSEVSPS